MQVAVESNRMLGTEPVDVAPDAKAATRACGKISLAATAGKFTAAKVASTPTAEVLAEVAAVLQSYEEVAVVSISMLVTQ